MNKVINDINRLWDKLCENTRRGTKWFGPDGFLNLETAALAYLFLVIFLSIPCAVAVTMCGAVIKCAYDAYHGSIDERHDILCAGLGVVVGIILSLAFGVTIS